MTDPSKRIDSVTWLALGRAVRSACPAWLRDQRDDLVQMAAMKLLRGKEQPPYGMAFLRRVAYSVVIDQVRRHKRRKEVGMSPSMPDRIANSGDLSPETRARGAQAGQALLACLDELIPSRKRAVVLYLQDEGIPQIAERLEISKKTANNLVYRGLADLRERLRDAGVTP